MGYGSDGIVQQCVWVLDLLVSSPDVVPPPTVTNGDVAAVVAIGVGTSALATAVMRDALHRTPTEWAHIILQQCVWWLDLLVSSPDVDVRPSFPHRMAGDALANVLAERLRPRE